jgi:hypothetical protein
MTPHAAKRTRLSYWVEAGGTISRVAGPWDTWLGDDGEVPYRSRERDIVGSGLFSFIEGEGVRSVYNTIHARVLETGKSVEFPFRCDSPWIKREMQMRISREADALRYDSIIIRETRRDRPLPRPTASADTFVAMCSFCKSYRFPVESTAWKEIESLFEEPNLPDLFSITHGICEPCAAAWLREL